MNKRICALMTAMCLASSSAMALTVSDVRLEGSVSYPDEASAVYTYRYSYPITADDDELADMINGFYTYQVDDALAFAAPMMAESVAPAAEPSHTDVSGKVTCLNDDYLSVLVTSRGHIDGYDSTVYSAQTFALTGPKRGNVASLPWIMGLLKEAENDTWLEDRQTAKADELVRTLVWERMQENEDNIPYYDDISEELLADIFYPEEDFFMDEDGRLVFFLQPGYAADESAGRIDFAFELDDILDEL
ncbi:MAG: hypothetical protein Q4C54_01985 [Clostridia bacterium]|nr:hypothetical protein [Clostridia bacterium]